MWGEIILGLAEAAFCTIYGLNIKIIKLVALKKALSDGYKLSQATFGGSKISFPQTLNMLGETILGLAEASYKD